MKLLWVVYDFVQAGGQRYVYEISKALDKEKYQIDFLRMSPMNYDKNWASEFYYKPTLALQGSVYTLEDFFLQKSNPDRHQPFLKRATDFILRKILKREKPGYHSQNSTKNTEKLASFFQNYHHINFAGVPVYKAVVLGLNMEVPHAVIHILTAKFQDKNLYAGLDKNKRYNFVSGIKPESIQSELAGFTDYKFTNYNICFETVPYEVNRNDSRDVFKIAVFTRLSVMKPLDPYFYALKILREQGLNVGLDIYGAGDPDELGLTNQLSYLYLKEDVKFCGHVDDIPATLKKQPPHLLWFQSTNSQPAGYAALEIAMSGLPQVFWDFMYMGHADDTTQTFASFTEITSFANYTKDILQSPGLQVQIGEKQRTFVTENYSIKEHIHILEELFDNK